MEFIYKNESILLSVLNKMIIILIIKKVYNKDIQLYSRLNSCSCYISVLRIVQIIIQMSIFFE